MGNRALITTEKKDLAIYLHWCGDKKYIDSFIAYCFFKLYRKPEEDDYGWARLVQVITNYFCNNSGLSVGIQKFNPEIKNTNDNGIYIIKDWHVINHYQIYDGEIEIIKDEFEEDEKYKEWMINLLLEINDEMPVSEKLTRQLIIHLFDKWLKVEKEIYHKKEELNN